MALLSAKVAPDSPDVKPEPVRSKTMLGIGLGLYVGESLLRGLGVFRGKETMQPVDLRKLVEPYLDTGLYLAVTEDNTSVVATGKTIRDAMNHAADQGCADPVIMRAPSRKAIENSLHL